MAKIVWSPPALRQLDELGHYIALQSEPAARAVVRRVVKRVERLTAFPKKGRAVRELWALGYRQLWCKPCWVYYRLAGTRIFIVHVRRAERLFKVDELFSDE